MKSHITKGEPYYERYGCYEHAWHVPYYVNGKFLCNLVTEKVNAKKGRYAVRNRAELAKHLINLRRNRYKFCVFHAGRFSCPFELIAWVRAEGYSFEEPKLIVYDNRADFHGNVREYSCAFHFRIYDSGLIEQIKEQVKEIRIR